MADYASLGDMILESLDSQYDEIMNSLEANNKTEEKCEKVNFSSPEVMGMDPQERLTLIQKFGKALEISRDACKKRYIQSAIEMLPLIKLFLDEMEYENAFMLSVRALEIMDRFNDESYFGEIFSEKDSIVTTLKKMIEALKQSLKTTYEYEYDCISNGDDVKSLLQDRKYTAVKEISPETDEEFIALYTKYVSPRFFRTKPIELGKSAVRNDKDYQLGSGILKHEPSKCMSYIVPSKLCKKFLLYAADSTAKGLKTKAFLCASKDTDGTMLLSDLLLSPQLQSPTYVEDIPVVSHNVIKKYLENSLTHIMGIIYTCVSDSNYTNSDDLHALHEIEVECPSALAIACVPNNNKTAFFTLTNYGMEIIGLCKNQAKKHAHEEGRPLTEEANNYVFVDRKNVRVMDFRFKFESGMSEDELAQVTTK